MIKSNGNSCYFLFLLIIVILNACVPAKKYEELQLKNVECKEKFSTLISDWDNKTNLLIDEKKLEIHNLERASNKQEKIIKKLKRKIEGLLTSSNPFNSNNGSNGSSSNNTSYNSNSNNSNPSNQNYSNTTIIIDTLSQLHQNINEGNVAIYCPKEMTYEMSSDVIGFVSNILEHPQIKEIMIKKMEEQDNQTFNSSNLLVKKVKLYKYIKLELNDSDNKGFTIKPIHSKTKQKISKNMEGWFWKVTPTTTIPKQQLVVKVTVYDENNELEIPQFAKTYNIDINIDESRFFRNFTAFFVENTEWAVGSIIVPILTFLFGMFRERRKKINENLA